MIYIYRAKPSESANMLAEELPRNARRIRQTVNLRGSDRNLVVCWGEAAPQGWPAERILNGAPIRNKYADAEALKAAGIATIAVSRNKPAQTVQPPTPPDPLMAAWGAASEATEIFHNLQQRDPRSRLSRDSAQEVVVALQAYINGYTRPAPVAPPVQVVEWVGRMNSHVGGNDLLRPPQVPDFFVKKETFRSEYRVHSFMGRSIRGGIKVKREDFAQPSTWIRSWDGGWKISYDGDSLQQKHRDIAHAAVAALGLQFGAVDIGERADGTLCVLEVNRAPGMEGGTIPAYTNAIAAWAEGN